MKFPVAAMVLALSASAPAAAAPSAPGAPANSLASDARCLVSFYFVVVLHDAKQGTFTDEGANAARDGFLYYAGRLNSRTNDAGIRAAVAEALKDKSTDVKAAAEACLHAMADPLDKTQDAVKSAVK
jgi:hypothetical protein